MGATATIWKYTVRQTDSQEIEMPAGAKILAVRMQGSVLTLWAMVDPSEPKESRTIQVYGTGHPAGSAGVYIGTVQHGPMVWHIFEDGVN